MIFVALALRNLARNRRRTALSLLIIAAGGVALLLTAGFIRFSFDGLREAIIHGGLGHLEVLPRSELGALEVSTDRTSPPSLEDWESLRARIEEVPHVRAVSGAIPLHGIVSRGERTVAFLGAALEPGRERAMGLVVKLRAGKPLPESPPAEGEDVVLLGRGLARVLQVEPGDVVTVMGLTTDGTLNALDLSVCGLVTTGVQDLDVRFLRVHLATAQRLLATSAVASLIVGLDDTAHTATARAEIEQRLAGRNPPLAVADWESRAPFYGQVRALYSGIFWFLGGIVFVLICLAASNTLLMAVLERVREIGTLRAIGTSRGQVVAMVVLEALWLGLLGGLLGNLLGLALVAGINRAGIHMPAPPGGVDPIDLRLTVAPADCLLVLLVMVTVLGVAAVLPAARAVRLCIVEALGHV
jgi:putative ABC transport system permease protein